jgi:hypothetical protein
MRRVLWLVSFAIWFGVGGSVLAQDEVEEEAEVGAPEETADPAAEGDEPEPAAAEDSAAEAPAAASGARTWWIGPFFEMAIVPSFLINVFTAESPTVANPAFGATVTHRDKDGFSWILGLGYTGYGFDGPFRAKGDPEVDTEYLNSTLGLLHVRGQLMWSTEISSMFAFEYGVGLELGVVLGELVRSEAYRDASGEFQRCLGPGNPDVSFQFCEATTNGAPTNRYDEEGAHYGVVEERVPPVAPMLMVPALALRFTPIEQLQIKLEASFGLMQFTFGLSAAYGLGG